ncbi:hypothetical protein BYT27DRAFT_6413421 [Phlegmacium glaucopus]|nr:hypothetical protein BYT27DRAFT_6413421 [Phlegmacium glaucopus]
MLDRSLAVDPRFTLSTAGFEGESDPTDWKLENIRRCLNIISPPSTEGTREKSKSGATVSSRKLADKVAPSCNVSRGRSFNGRVDQWTVRVVEFLQFVIIGGCNSDNMVSLKKSAIDLRPSSDEPSIWECQHCGTAGCCKLGGRTKIRAYHGWPRQRVRQGIKRYILDAGEQRIGYFGKLHTMKTRRNEVDYAPHCTATFPWPNLSSLKISSMNDINGPQTQTGKRNNILTNVYLKCFSLTSTLDSSH